MAPLFLELEMNLTQEMKDFVHLMARALAKTSGSQTPEVFADVVLEHAVALATPVVPEVVPADTPAA
jgi:hypothetical protein